MCLRCLGWLLKYPLPSLKSNIQKIAQGMFVLLKNYASVGAAKGDNFELVSLLFKVIL
jgi:U3 small nucleolar RNA-associated protein 20